MSNAPDRRAILLLVFGAGVIGAGTVLVRLSGTGPAAAGFWRLLFALPMLALLTAGERRRGGGGTGLGAAPVLLVFCGFAFAADLVSWHYSLALTAIANSTVLANLTPVIVTVLAWLVFRERPAPRFLAGLALAMGGAATMALSRTGGHATAPLLGDGLAVLASLWYALYFIAVRSARRTASALQVMTASSLIGAPIMLVPTLMLHETILPSTIVGWCAVTGLGLMHVSGQGAIAWSLGRVPTALAAVVVLVQPVVAAIAGWLVFHEAISPGQALGALLALGGVALAQAAARRAAAPVAGEAEALPAKA